MSTRTTQPSLEDHLMVRPEGDRGKDFDRTPSTQAAIMRRVSGATEETLFWLRADLAKEWLIRKHGSEEVAKKVMPQSQFWWWWLRLWAMTDNEIIAGMDKRGIDTINWNLYVQIMKEHSHEKWIPGKVFPAINVKI